MLVACFPATALVEESSVKASCLVLIEGPPVAPFLLDPVKWLLFFLGAPFSS